MSHYLSLESTSAHACEVSHAMCPFTNQPTWLYISDITQPGLHFLSFVVYVGYYSSLPPLVGHRSRVSNVTFLLIIVAGVTSLLHHCFSAPNVFARYTHGLFPDS